MTDDLFDFGEKPLSIEIKPEIKVLSLSVEETPKIKTVTILNKTYEVSIE
jgi:hypothetical protein